MFEPRPLKLSITVGAYKRLLNVHFKPVNDFLFLCCMLCVCVCVSVHTHVCVQMRAFIIGCRVSSSSHGLTGLYAFSSPLHYIIIVLRMSLSGVLSLEVLLSCKPSGLAVCVCVCVQCPSLLQKSVVKNVTFSNLICWK